MLCSIRSSYRQQQRQRCLEVFQRLMQRCFRVFQRLMQHKTNQKRLNVSPLVHSEWSRQQVTPSRILHQGPGHAGSFKAMSLAHA
mmetsp:Transcript_134260/g.261468  ORF Transcript_134260/g.261468 Transcript_134260/m.261468 type:complete len:85 (-) Transcript_134260:49-303(-)